MILRSIFQNKSYLLALISFIAIVAISLMKSAMELEDAEQAYFSQWLRLGYDDQPPLYTWLQYMMNSVLGVAVISFSILRALLFAFIIGALYNFSKVYLNEISKANLVVFSLGIIPVFIDFTFRRLSHTSLLCLAVILTYILLQNLISKKTTRNYVLLGIVVAIGILAKYNYIMVIGTMLIASFVDKELGKVIWNRKILISILLAALLVAPHFYWLLSNQIFLEELSASIALKTMAQSKAGIPVLSPLLTMLVTLLKVLAPIVLLLLLSKVFKKIRFIASSKHWLFKMLLVQFAVILLFFVVMDVQKTEERWFLPLLLPFLPLLIQAIAFKTIKKWEIVGYYLFLFILFVQTIRTPIEKVFKIPSDVHFGFQPISEKLNKKYSNNNWVLPNVTYAGNIKLLNSTTEIYAADDFSLPAAKLNNGIPVEIVIGKEQLNGRSSNDSILDFGRHKQTIYFISDENDQ